MSSTAGAVANPRLSRGLVPVERHFLTAAIGTVFALFVVLPLVLLLRRLSGAFVQPLSGRGLVMAAVALGVVAAGLRWAGTQYPVLGTRISAAWMLLYALPGVAAILLLASLTLSGTPALGVIIAWFALIAGEAASWFVLFRTGQATFLRTRDQTSPDDSTQPEEDEATIQAGLVQQLTRVREEGRESIHALLRAEIPAGDGLAILHIAFCPPLDAQPELAAHAMDADDAEVRITQAETFGARLEVRVPRPVAEGRSIVVEVVGSVTSPGYA